MAFLGPLVSAHAYEAPPELGAQPHQAATIISEHYYSIVTDHLGTPKELLNEKGDLPWKSRHKLWGEVIEISQWVKPENRGNTCDLRF